MDFLDDYLGEIMVGTGISILLGFFGMVRSFFSGIRRMETKLRELEDKLEDNTERDEKLSEWVTKLVDQKMAGK